MIKLIVGLGNPGAKYEKTRHNAGFLFVDYLGSAVGCRWVGSAQFHGDVSECNIAGNKVLLLKPMTFMNKSGIAVGGLLRYYKISPEQMMVVHDELELSEGVVRLKRDGGHAGHNGLRDIIANIGSRDFYRLRIGIGRPSAEVGVADYVLSGISAVTQTAFTNLFADLTKNAQSLISGDIDAVNELRLVV